MGHHGAAQPTGGTAGRVHFLPPQDIPSSSAGDVSAAPAASSISHSAVVAQPDAYAGATWYPADAPAVTVMSMLRVQAPFAWKLELPGRKMARLEFVAAMWEAHVETHARNHPPPPLRISFSCAITMPSGLQLKESEKGCH